MPTRTAEGFMELGTEALSAGTGGGLSRVAVIVPAWQPDAGLVWLVDALAQAGFGCLVVVDDGSSTRCRPVFRAVAAAEGAVVLQHGQNWGKGRALKTAFRYLQANEPELVGVVTADADGQHTPEDVVRVAEALLRGDCARPVLGVRSFGEDVPLRSRVGNEVTRRVFRWLTGVRLRDTQTGLRGLPITALEGLAALPGERYEYEMAMLAALCQAGWKPVEAPIATMYAEGNRGSHFRTVQDSVHVYEALAQSIVRHRLGQFADWLHGRASGRFGRLRTAQR